MEEQKQKIIEKLLYELYCFRSEEIHACLQRVESFQEEGLDAFIRFLKEAKREYDNFLTKRISENPAYFSVFKNFVSEKMADIQKRTGKGE